MYVLIGSTASKCTWFQRNYFLYSLQAIQLLWFSEICKVAWRVITGKGAEDTRSDDEEYGFYFLSTFYATHVIIREPESVNDFSVSSNLSQTELKKRR